MAGKRDLFINGQWVAAKSKATFPVYNPSTGEVWANVADASRADASAAIEAAAEAQPKWAALAHSEREEAPAPQTSVPEITPRELKSRLDRGDDLYILDVREPHEYQICNLGGHLIPLGDLSKRVSELDSSREIVAHCRSGKRSAEAVDFLRKAGFRKILMRGDSKFAQTKHLDRWDDAGDIRFIFGYESHESLKARADELPTNAYSLLKRPQQHQIKTTPREKPERVKQEIVRERGYETVHLLEEMVAEFEYRPVACKKSYRMIVLRKRVGVDKGQMRLFEEYRYFFYITNDRKMTAKEVVFSANDRCEQENLIAQLKSGVRALTAPVDDLVSNWAYMVMGSLAWSLKAWSALMVPVSPQLEAEHKAEKRKLLRMEFPTFCAAFIQMPCQIVRGGRRLIYRLLSWNPWQDSFLRLAERLHSCWLC